MNFLIFIGGTWGRPTQSGGRTDVESITIEYLAGYMGRHQDVPDISIELVMKVAGLIEKMGRQRLKPRNDNE